MTQWNEFLPCLHSLSPHDQLVIEEAFKLGEEAHGHQKRQSGEPFFSHPIAVARMLAAMGADRDTIVAALLHDTVEDTTLSLERIREVFGTPVANLVDGVTKLMEQDLGGQATLNEQIESLRKMFTLMQDDVRIMVIKLADRLHNMQTISGKPKDRQMATARETLDIYVKIADRLCMTDVRNELENLSHAVLEPEIHESLMNMRREHDAMSQSMILILQEKMQKIAPDMHVLYQFEYKRWEKLQQQVNTPFTVEPSKHVLNIAITCENIDTCYRMLGLLHRLWNHDTLSFEDFISAPAINGYRGLHTVVIMESGMRVRCKIRTRDMSDYAHKGITMVCFGEDRDSVASLLPWTGRISPLAKDTKSRSDEFWDGLQNDIFAETMVVYGPNNISMLIPRGSTALDAVFYLFGKKGIFTQSVVVNGKQTSLQEMLNHASTVVPQFAETPRTQLSWLQFIRTGTAAAMIRMALSEQSTEEKQRIGQALLQAHFLSRRRGFIEEFDNDIVARVLRQRGFDSLGTVYTQLAEGRTTVHDIEFMLFPVHTTRSAGMRHASVITGDIASHQVAALIGFLQTFQPRMTRIRHRGHNASIAAILYLSQQEREELKQSVLNMFDVTIDIRPIWRYAIRFSLLLAFFVLTGLDPVFAKKLLIMPSVTPFNLTVTRFLSVTLLSALALPIIRRRREIPEEPLSIFSWNLWASAFLLACVAASTYLSLQGTDPSYYTIPMTAAGLTVVTLQARKRMPYMIAWALLIWTMIYLILKTPTWPIQSVIFTLIAVISTTCLQWLSEYYKREEKVALRTSQYFFLLYLIASLFILPLFSVADFGSLSLKEFGLMALFSIIFTGVPYYMYFALLSYSDLKIAFSGSSLIIVFTLLGETLFLRTPSFMSIAAGATVIIAVLAAGFLEKRDRVR